MNVLHTVLKYYEIGMIHFKLHGKKNDIDYIANKLATIFTQLMTSGTACTFTYTDRWPGGEAHGLMSWDGCLTVIRQCHQILCR